MAALSPNPYPLTTDGNTSPHQTDPFWQTAPRATTRELELLMAARALQQQLVILPPTNAQRTNRPQSAVARRPQCTHMTMNRLYGEHTCHMCGKVPSMGFVYSCQQDRLLRYQHSVPEAETLPVIADSGNYFEAQAKIADSIGMSRSVIKQMRAGEYSFDQIETLLQQRRHVLEVIKKAENPSTQSTPSSPVTSKFASQPATETIIASVGAAVAPAVQTVVGSSLPMSPAGTPANTPAESANATPTRKSKSAKKLTCNFQVCHTCRPYFQDRLHMSFNTMLNNEAPAVTEEEIKKLPLLDANVVREIGLRQPPRPALHIVQSRDKLISMSQGDGGGDDTPTDWTPTSTTDSMAETDSQQDGVDPFPCPGSGICPLWIPQEGCAYDHGFDDGLRAQNHGFEPDYDFEDGTVDRSYNGLHHARGKILDTPGGTSSTASSISLPEPRTEPLTPLTPTDPSFSLGLANKLHKVGKAATVCGVAIDDRKRNYGFWRARLPGKDSSSSLGSEVEVEGGVALTEEAVESGMPDIATTD